MSVFVPCQERFPMFGKLAAKSGRRVVVLDTETTGLLHTPPVGVVDLAMLVVGPNGRAEVMDSLVDPEIPIPAGASNVHGIYEKDVAGANTFEFFISVLKEHFRESVIAGFNSRSYDVPVLLQNMERYRQPGSPPEVQLDVRDLWTRDKRQQKGKLTEVAAILGVETGTAHRALGDVLTTARIFEAMVAARGTIWLEQISPETFGGQKYQRKLPTTPEIAAIREAVEEGRQLTPATILELSAAKKVHPTALSFSLTELLKSGEIAYEQCVDDRSQDAIRSVLEKAMEKLAPSTGEKFVRLKPLKDLLDSMNGCNNDYNQIRIALAARNERKQENEFVR